MKGAALAQTCVLLKPANQEILILMVTKYRELHWYQLRDRKKQSVKNEFKWLDVDFFEPMGSCSSDRAAIAFNLVSQSIRLYSL